jgi:mono/diheme cytochrome c family protein
MNRRTIALVATAVAVSATPAAAQQMDPVKVGQGAQVFATTCGRCHNARTGPERTDAQWVAIVAHMRARANLTKSQAEAVLAFLQATNLPSGGVVSIDGAATVVPPDLEAVLVQYVATAGPSSRGDLHPSAVSAASTKAPFASR